jgi:hypothetical protein
VPSSRARVQVSPPAAAWDYAATRSTNRSTSEALRPRILLLRLNVADDMDRASKRTRHRGRQLICMPLRAQSG